MGNNLVPYIKEQLKRGYNITAVRSYLINSGYPAHVVDDSIRQLHKPALSMPVLIGAGGAVVVILIIFLGLSLFAPPKVKQPSQLLDLETTAVTKSVHPGEDFSFILKLTSLGTEQRYDVELSHELINPNNNRVVNMKSETAAIETRMEKESSIDIPQTANPGTYFLRTIASYDTRRATATLTIIVQEEIIEPLCPSFCDDEDACTTDFCSGLTNYQCAHDVITPCCGDDKCEAGEDESTCSLDCEADVPLLAPAEGEAEEELEEEMPARLTMQSIIKEMRKTADTNLELAGVQCSKVENSAYKDGCFVALASHANTHVFCGQIQETNKKDQCYIDYAMNNDDYTICESINDGFLKKSCITLSEI